MTPKQCSTCGQPHARCTAHRRDGTPCRTHPVKGLTVCRMHGGSTKRAKAKSARKQAEDQAAKAVTTLGLATDISPAEALLEEIRWTSGHVQWLRSKVQELNPDELTWGTVETTQDHMGTTIKDKAGPSIWYELYTRERQHLVTVAAAALRANIDERRVRLAEAQGEQLAAVIRAILDDLRLTSAQQRLVGTVVPRHLRAIGGSQ